MSSTPEDGEVLPLATEDVEDSTDLPNETVPDDLETDEISRKDPEILEDVDTIPELDASTTRNALEVEEQQDNLHDAGSLRQAGQLGGIARQPASLDGSGSIPDDTLSVQTSGVSSPKYSAQPTLPPPISRKTSAASRRPFELRFQSRLSGSYLHSPRPASPAFLGPHSRHSSLASFGPASDAATEEGQTPWEVIRWTRLKKLTGQAFSEMGRRNFGSPTTLAVTDHIVVGTSKGFILVYDHQQNNKAVIGAGTKAAEAGPVTALAISADHSAVAAGHETGHIFTWEISRPTRPFMHIPPVEIAQAESRKTDGHVQGSAVLHIGFIGYRRTALVSADDRGMAFSHLATRGTGSLGRSVRTTRILGRYPELIVRRSAKPIKKSSVLAFSTLPLGNVEQNTDSLGLVAMLTPYLLVIVSTTPIAQTQHKAARPKEVVAHSAMTAALAWFPAIKLKGSDTEVSKNKLVYAWSNVMSVLEVEEIPREPDAPENKPVELQFTTRSRYQAEEGIVAVQWLSRSVIAALTITQQLLIIEDVTMNVTDAFDLLPKNLYHADLFSAQLQSVVETLDEDDASMHGVVADGYYMSFRGYKGRLYLLGFADLWWGSLTNWADRLLAMMEAGDFIGAIRLATNYFSGSGEKVTIGLPEDDALRSSLVRDKLLEMMSASLRYAFGKNEQASRSSLAHQQLVDLAVACVAACLKMEEYDYMFDEVFDWYDENEAGDIFVDVLEPHILDRQITSLTPSALKLLINHFAKTHSPSQLEEVICLLDATTMDVDQVTTLCKQYRLYDAYIYVWNTALFDYASPLLELLRIGLETSMVNGDGTAVSIDRHVGQKMFPYISFVLTSRVYPIGDFMDDERAVLAKTQIYEALFHRKGFEDDPFSVLRSILHYDAPDFLAAMNEAFEDSFLNNEQDDQLEGNQMVRPAQRSLLFNRQIIIRILLDIMSTGFEVQDRIYLDMFIARSLPKYPQYILLPDTTLEEVLLRLCDYGDEDLYDDAQLSAEYLISVFQPVDVSRFIPVLFKAKFYRILKTIFRQEGDWIELIRVHFIDTENLALVFDLVMECLRPRSVLNEEQRQAFQDEVKSHAVELANFDVVGTAKMVDTALPTEHSFFIEALSSMPRIQFIYLQTLMEPDDSQRRSRDLDSGMMEQYVCLICQYNPAHVVEYVNTIKEGEIHLDKVLPSLETSGNIDAAVILLARQGQVKDGMDRLIKHISTLEAALSGVLENASDSPDEVATNEVIEDLLESINKYAKVGIWLAESQMQTFRRKGKASAKSPRRSSVRQALSFEETIWLDFIIAIVSIAQKVDPVTWSSAEARSATGGDELSNTLRSIIQHVFTALLNSTAIIRGETQTDSLAFLRILRAFLSRAAELSPSLSHLRHVLGSIFAAYSYEESFLSLSNAMLDKDLFVQVDEVAKLRQQGWRPKGQICGICKKRVWGPGSGQGVWDAWQNLEKEKSKRRSQLKSFSEDEDEAESTSRGKGKATAEVDSDADEEQEAKSANPGSDAGSIVVFSCRHIYHKKCLEQRESSGHLEGLPSAQEPVEEDHHVPRRLVCPACRLNT